MLAKLRNGITRMVRITFIRQIRAFRSKIGTALYSNVIKLGKFKMRHLEARQYVVQTEGKSSQALNRTSLNIIQYLHTFAQRPCIKASLP